MKIFRDVLVAAAVIAAVAACSRTADAPRPTHTFEPSVAPTQSVKPSAKRETACSLMTAEERRSLAGTTMDRVMPSNPVVAVHQCKWVHSFTETVTMSVQVDAMDSRDWAKQNLPTVSGSVRNPKADTKMISDVRDAATDIRSGKLTRERACEIYSLMTRLMGFTEDDEVVFPNWTSQDEASVVSTSCLDGVVTSVTYTERHLYPTPSLGDLVVKARQAVEKRAVERFGADAEPSATPTPRRVR
jgi:hypothetical protein